MVRVTVLSASHRDDSAVIGSNHLDANRAPWCTQLAFSVCKRAKRVGAHTASPSGAYAGSPRAALGLEMMRTATFETSQILSVAATV